MIIKTAEDGLQNKTVTHRESSIKIVISEASGDFI